MPPPNAAQIAAAVAAQRDFAGSLFDQLRQDGADDPGVTRDPYGPGEQRAHATMTAAARNLGLEIGHDAAANLYMTCPGRDRTAPRVVIGSHLEFGAARRQFRRCRRRGGRASSPLSALAALGFTPRCDITVMGIRAEESIWFQVSYIGSRGALGTLPDGALDVRRIDTGRTLAEHIAECGGDPGALARQRSATSTRSTLRAYLELHIEQAPSLVEAGKPVAICTGIPGNFRYPDARIEGSHDHVGLPRRFRRDAAIAGAEFAMAIDRLWEDHEARGIPMAATLGRFHTDPAAHGLTIVPGAFHLSLDVRAYDEAVLAELDRAVDAIIAGIEQRRGVRFHRGPKARCRGGQGGPGDPRGTHPGRGCAGHSHHAAGQPGLARRGGLRGLRRAHGHDLRAQRQRQPQSARGDDAGRFPRRDSGADAVADRGAVLASTVAVWHDWQTPTGRLR